MVKLSEGEIAGRILKIKNLAKTRGKVHYTEIAYELKCSPSVAISWCKIVANMDKNFKYENGYLEMVGSG